MQYSIAIHQNNRVTEIKAEAGTNLLEILRGLGAEIDTPCNGKGTCGKCRVKVNGLPNGPGEAERKLLGKPALGSGYRLACYNTVDANLELFLDPAAGSPARILSDGKVMAVRPEPYVSKRVVRVDPPSLDDQRSDSERLAARDPLGAETGALELLRHLPETLRQNDHQVTLIYHGTELAGIEPGDTGSTAYGVAFDIGTTTVVAYLADLSSGRRLGASSELNPQRRFGADVISRIQHTVSEPDGLETMSRTIVDCANRLIARLAADHRLEPARIVAASFAGNPTMIHFLLKLPARNLSVSPFIPVTTRLLKLRAAELNLDINPSGLATVLPSVSAYIGADTVAAILASGMDRDSRITLLVDIGTNGEIVLGNADWLYACSAAAGPAFEGANIRNGIGGVQGAIDRVRFVPEFGFDTIGDAKPVGICGTGLVDAVAGMLDAGLLDETGRLNRECRQPEWRERLLKLDGQNAFRLVEPGESAGNQAIVLTQKDIRELQSAKAAIAAGIKVLASRAGIGLDQVERVCLAGGFGSYIHVESALRIGLFPAELRGKIEAIGNAAGEGAVAALLSESHLAACEQIKKRVRYIELSTCPEFNDFFIDSMVFPG
jgi:uncharacterized 2Fe-2S/4Fe-4S cluster protein (DUF4445 family)